MSLKVADERFMVLGRGAVSCGMFTPHPGLLPRGEKGRLRRDDYGETRWRAVSIANASNVVIVSFRATKGSVEI